MNDILKRNGIKVRLRSPIKKINYDELSWRQQRNIKRRRQWIGITVIVLGILGISTAITLVAVNAHEKHVQQIADQYHYKHAELAYCDQIRDDKDGDDNGWIPCSVISADNKNYTSYFVSFSPTDNANISVEDMRKNAQQ